MALRLDRMEIEESGRADPERLAAAIHRQLGDAKGAVPVHEIALALDIIEIRERQVDHLEGALVTDAERDEGSILVNARSSSQRQRYSIGHELLHFLNPLHQPTSASGFECSKSDMAAGGAIDRPGLTRHQRQEIEANHFAIELLAPPKRMAPFLRAAADLEHVLRAANELDLSKQAVARRYVKLHRESLAVLFSKNDAVTYPDWGPRFPLLLLKKGDRLPSYRPASSRDEATSTMDEVDAAEWLKSPGTTRLYCQSHSQADGHSITLLLSESAAYER